MALPKRATKPSTPPAAEPADENVITSVTVSRGFKVGGSDFSSGQTFVSVAASDYETASASVDEYLALEIEKLGAAAQELGIDLGGSGDNGEVGEEEAEAEGADEAETAEGEEEGLTADDINAMKRPDIEALIAENSLETDASSFPKNAKGLTALREAVIAEAFGDAEEAEEEAEGDEAEEAEEGGEEAEISEDDINAMERPALVAFIKENELDVDPKKFPKLSGLKAAVIEVLTDAAEEEPESEAEEGDEADAAYTEADLKAMDLPALKGIWSDWEMPGKFPPGPPVPAKKAAIAKILAFQNEE